MPTLLLACGPLHRASVEIDAALSYEKCSWAHGMWAISALVFFEASSTALANRTKGSQFTFGLALLWDSFGDTGYFGRAAFMLAGQIAVSV